MYWNCTKTLTDVDQDFAHDVEQGLSEHTKRIPSKYFYDEIGDGLFVKIMNMPEYYLTDCEFEIFNQQSDAIIDGFELQQPFELVELGAGDGTKTIELLKRLLDRGLDFTYMPVDISSHAVEGLVARLTEELPELKVEGKQGEYFEVLTSLNNGVPKAILFLGSNIGNLSDPIAKTFMRQLSENMQVDDKLLVGFDMQKGTDVILPAYDDSQGYTRAFNMNLLTRMNKELGARFDLEKFEHLPMYDEEHGLALSYLVSLEDQEVYIESLDKTFSFTRGERIHTEISRKYSDEIIQLLIEGTGLKVHHELSDSRAYFKDIIFTKTL